jgi:hypothetical protein
MAKILFFSTLLFLAAAPFLSSAATQPSIWPTGYWGPFVSCTGNPYSDLSTNPPTPNSKFCKSLDDLIQTFLNVVSFGMTIVLFILAPIFFVWGGVMILIAGASPERLANGKKILTGTVIGVAIILASYLILSLFVGLLGASGIGGF